jgi:hypothetical protein
MTRDSQSPVALLLLAPGLDEISLSYTEDPTRTRRGARRKSRAESASQARRSRGCRGCGWGGERTRF